MPYNSTPFNYYGTSNSQIKDDLDKANQNFSILAQAFYNNDPSSQPILRASYVGPTAPSNPVAGMTWLNTASNPPVLWAYDGSIWHSNADTVDGFHASQTPSANTIVPLNSSGILDLSSTYIKSNVYTFRRVDLTNATSDYLLQVGEEAYISFSGTTSVPLRIATQSGTYYECHLNCGNTGGTSGATAAPIYLNPNNTIYSNAFVYAEVNRIASLSGSNYFTYPSFRIGYAFVSSVFYITNFVQYKNVKGFNDAYGIYEGYPLLVVFTTDWRDTTTPWTSLGTVTFPQAASGYILVRRLV